MYLNELKTSTITIYQISEEIKQFRFVIILNTLIFYSITHEFDETKHLSLIVEHVFVIIVHLFQEIHTTNVFINVMNHFWDLFYH